MKLDSLEPLEDAELRSVIARSEELLKARDEKRKSKALADARALLESVGLHMKDLAGKGRAKLPKAAAYKGGVAYQHPTDKTLVWKAKGQKPRWLRELEAGGGKALEMQPANDNAAPSVRKSG